MGRVSQDTLDKLQAFFDSMPSEVTSKCALCNDTLVHYVKRAEVETGAGTATVTRILAESINEGAAPQDVVSGKALTERVRQKEGKTTKNRDPVNNPPPVEQHNVAATPTTPANHGIKPAPQSSSMDNIIAGEQYATKFHKRKDAIAALKLDKFCELSSRADWPEDLVGFIRRTLSKRCTTEAQLTAVNVHLDNLEGATHE